MDEVIEPSKRAVEAALCARLGYTDRESFYAEHQGSFSKALEAEAKPVRAALSIEHQRWEQGARERLTAATEKFWEIAGLRSDPTLTPYETGKLAGLEAAEKAIFGESDGD